MLTVLVTLIGLNALGAIFLAWGRARALERIRTRADAECRRRLESVAGALEGRLVDGPALQTAAGTITLVRGSGATSRVIEQTQFAAPFPGARALGIAPESDAAGPLRLKFVQPVDGLDPAIVSGYRVTASDEAFARAVVTRSLLDAVRALEARSHSRIQIRVVGGKASILANRGLATPDELCAFHDGCAEVIRLVRVGTGK